MKKVSLLFPFSFFILCFLFLGTTFGYIVQEPTGLLFGQEHDYSVFFRGNQEAIVYGKINISNTTQSALRDFVFEIPGVTPSEIVIYQMENYNSDTSNPSPWFDDYNYRNDYNYNAKYQYNKLEFSKSGQIYNVDLAKDVYENDSTTLLIAYSTKGYVKNYFGLYKYNFETIKVASRIKSIKVAVNVDSELYLKGKKSSINYNDVSFQYSMQDLNTNKSFFSSEMDALVGGIGVSGGVVKSANNLAPNESFTVKGEYATSGLRLYLGNILLFIVIIAVVTYISINLPKLIKQRKEMKMEDGNTKSKDKTINSVIEKGNTNKNKVKVPLKFFASVHIILGLSSCVSVIVLTLLIRYILYSNILGDLLYGFESFETILAIVLGIMVLFLYIFAIFGPAILLAIKRGWKSFLIVLVMEFIWFLIFVIVLIFIVGPIFRATPGYNNGGSYPYY